MPYIKQTDRDQYRNALSLLIHTLNQNDWTPGHLNYIISSLLRAGFSGHRRYTRINALLGDVQGALLEWYRVDVAPYEDTKRDENGSVP